MALPRSALIAIVAATLTALGVRIAAAGGAPWLDEAWSAVFARDAGSAIGVLGIGHDNNHILNTLWLRAVGWPASPLAMRALSIASGAAAVPVAALIAARRGALAAALAAWLFALSPMLVTYGAEARGYAAMLLALLIAILLIDRALEGKTARSPALMIAVALGIGALAQLTIVFAMPALVGWVLWAKRGDRPLIGTAALLGPAVMIVAAVAAGTLSGGMQIGSYQPFEVALWYDALGEAIRYTLALGWLSKLWLPLIAAAAIFALVIARATDHRAALTLLGVLAFPIAVAVLGIGNSGHPRYYLVAAVLLLIAVAQAPRAVALPLAVVALAGSLLGDLELIRNRRGDPGAAIAAMVRLAPRGATVAAEQDRDTAVIELAAAQARYPLRLVEAPCPAADFLYVARDGAAPFPVRPVRCGFAYRPVASARTTGLSGSHWQLYLRAP